ncbi:MAG: hypothetical protein ABEK03_08765 [Candidatus Bipolaricaulia bacterium]
MTEVRMSSDRQVIAEAERVLWEHLGPAKATRFWIAMGGGNGDYLQLKARLFEGESVDTLYEAIRAEDEDE